MDQSNLNECQMTNQPMTKTELLTQDCLFKKSHEQSDFVLMANLVHLKINSGDRKKERT